MMSRCTRSGAGAFWANCSLIVSKPSDPDVPFRDPLRIVCPDTRKHSLQLCFEKGASYVGAVPGFQRDGCGVLLFKSIQGCNR